MRLGTLALLLLAAPPALAQDRPNEAELFGAPAEKKPEEKKAEEKKDEKKPDEKPADALPPGVPPAATPPEEHPAPPPSRPEPTPPPATPESTRDEALMGERDAATRLSQEVAPEDPLKLGGMFYLRAASTAAQGQQPQNWSFSTPALVDTYLDARPNERVRGLVLGRMFFDPAIPLAAPMGTIATQGSVQSGTSMGAIPLSTLLAPPSRGPTVVLDQMWLRFDIKHTVFVTAGKQHVRWGTGRFWSPTDFLHTLKRDPLAVFDARAGTSMLKLHVPWEERGWNFYAYGITEEPRGTQTVGQIAGAGRAEIVVGTMEVGAGAMVERGHKPKIAFDVSTGIWDVDAYGELAIRYGSEIARVSVNPSVPVPTNPQDFLANAALRYPATSYNGLRPQAVAGLTYSRKYHDNDVWNLGLEYFYNGLGYASPEVYPGLFLPRTLEQPAVPFYLGRQYGAIYLNIPAPYSWDLTTFTLSTLGNLSDRSFITRLDYSLLMLTHLRFEAYAAIHYGKDAGEFRFGVPALGRKPSLLDLGVALRISL